MGRARLFGAYAVARVGAQQGFDDRFFRRMVNFGDKVIGQLLRHAHRFNIEGGAVDDGPGSAGGLDGHIDHGVQIERHRL